MASAYKVGTPAVIPWGHLREWPPKYGAILRWAEAFGLGGSPRGALCLGRPHLRPDVAWLGEPGWVYSSETTTVGGKLQRRHMHYKPSLRR